MNDTTETTEEKCPKCGSTNTDKRHREPTFYLPETDFKECEDCDHQWGHQ